MLESLENISLQSLQILHMLVLRTDIFEIEIGATAACNTITYKIGNFARLFGKFSDNLFFASSLTKFRSSVVRCCFFVTSF